MVFSKFLDMYCLCFWFCLINIDMGSIITKWDYVAIELEDSSCKGFRNL
jgi:hypothetical protein